MNRAACIVWLSWICVGAGMAQDAPLSTTGITVGAPKVYDNYYLQLTLNGLRDQLAGLRVVDQTTLLSHIGQAQGANLQQVGVAFQGSGPSTPTTSTFALAPGTTPFSTTGTPTGTTPGTTTAATSLAPANPSPAATSLALPTVGQSSLDTLNESMQLSAEITGYQLLLNGALSDQQSPEGTPRTTFTIGFPVTIDPPGKNSKTLADSIAEVRVAICGVDGASIATLLPQERTYNVASLVDHSLAASAGAVLGGVFSIGGGFLWHHQSYYLVQQQETVALQEPQGGCSGTATTSTAFVWQIHPVLGKKFVRPGTQFNFVQVSIPTSFLTNTGTIANACVQVDWRRTKDHGNRLDEELTDANSRCFNVPAYTTRPHVVSLSVTDIGGGNVQATALGSFLSGTRIRIGSRLLAPGAVYISADQEHLVFSAAAADIASAGGVTILSRNDDEDTLQAGMTPVPSGSPTPPTPTPLTISNVAVGPYSNTQSLLTVTYARPTGSTLPFDPCVIPGAVKPPPCPPNDPYLVRIGTKLYGLADAPYLSANEKQIQLLVANDAIASAPELELMRLLWPPQFYYSKFPLNKDAVTVGKATLIATAPVVKFSVTGTNLDRARLYYPDCASCYTNSGPSFATVSLTAGPGGTGLDAAGLKALKQVVICEENAAKNGCDQNFPPVLLAIPSDDTDAAKSSKPKLEKLDPIKPGTSEVTIKGSGLDQIAAIRIEGNLVPYHLSADKEPALIVRLPSSVSQAGQYPLWIELADRSTMSYSISVASPK